MTGAILTRSLGVAGPIVTGGLGSSSAPASPGDGPGWLLTGGLGLGAPLVTRGLGGTAPSSPDLPVPVPQVFPFLLGPPPGFPVWRSLVQAIGMALAGDADLAGLLLGGGNGGPPALKVWHKLARAKTDPPWIVFEVPEQPATRINRFHYLTDGQIILTGRANRRPDAAIIADAAVRVVLAAYASGRILFEGGRLMDVSIVRDSNPRPPAHARLIGRVWSETRVLAFQYQPA
jgi:hypothetical protein